MQYQQMHTSVLKLIKNNFNTLACWINFFMYSNIASIMEYTNLINAQDAKTAYKNKFQYPCLQLLLIFLHLFLVMYGLWII
jgi:hypothetical protein